MAWRTLLISAVLAPVAGAQSITQTLSSTGLGEFFNSAEDMVVQTGILDELDDGPLLFEQFPTTLGTLDTVTISMTLDGTVFGDLDTNGIIDDEFTHNVPSSLVIGEGEEPDPDNDGFFFYAHGDFDPENDSFGDSDLFSIFPVSQTARANVTIDCFGVPGDGDSCGGPITEPFNVTEFFTLDGSPEQNASGLFGAREPFKGFGLVAINPEFLFAHSFGDLENLDNATVDAQIDYNLELTITYDYTPALGGDFNGDGDVDAADYTVWRDNLGEPEGTLENDTVGGTVRDLHFETWAANYGNWDAPIAVPEPSAAWLLWIVYLIARASAPPRFACHTAGASRCGSRRG